jgi:hypothetical protein
MIALFLLLLLYFLSSLYILNVHRLSGDYLDGVFPYSAGCLLSGAEVFDLVQSHLSVLAIAS